MFAIGMMSFTVLGTTTHQEQKLKPAIEMDYDVIQTEAVNVEITEMPNVFVQMHFIANQTYVKTETGKATTSVADDVGWHSGKVKYENHPFKEKLNSQSNFMRPIKEIQRRSHPHC